jgi:hypothetical protein
MTIKVGDIFAISKSSMVYDYTRVLELSKDHNQVFLYNLYINIELRTETRRIRWYPKSIIGNDVKKATKKDWYKVIRLYNELNVIYDF